MKENMNKEQERKRIGGMVATYIREMADWLRENHYNKVF